MVYLEVYTDLKLYFTVGYKRYVLSEEIVVEGYRLQGHGAAPRQDTARVHLHPRQSG